MEILASGNPTVAVAAQQNCDRVNLVKDCEGLIGMLDKPLSNIHNIRLQRILERVIKYSLIRQYIPGINNKVFDTLSRLCQSLAGYYDYYYTRSPRMLDLSQNLCKGSSSLNVWTHWS